MFIFCAIGYHNSVSYPNPQTPYIKEPPNLRGSFIFIHFSFVVLSILSLFFLFCCRSFVLSFIRLYRNSTRNVNTL